MHIEIFDNGRWVRAARIQAFGNERCRIDFVPDYVFAEQPSPLSLGMPVAFEAFEACEGYDPYGAYGAYDGDDQAHVDDWPDRRVPPFLYDLVPQGRGRQFLVRQLGLVDSDSLVMPLLAKGAINPIGCLRIDAAVDGFRDQAMGKDSLGAGEGLADSDIVNRPHEVTQDLLAHLSRHGMLAAGTTGVQGVAPKFLLTQRTDGQWFADLDLPDDQASAHWLVKLPRALHAADLLVHRNEAAYLRVAKACGIRSHQAPMLHGEMLFVRRFDRQVTVAGVVRLHQESLASAAGLRGFGVATTQNQLLRAVRKHASQPLQETIEFLKRDVLNLAMRNTDNHARNTALQRLPDGTVQLTPIFDFAPMFLDPEMVPRSVHWRDAKGRRLDGWADVVEALEITDDEKAQACRALRAFGDVVSNLEGIAMDCGVDCVVLEQCKASIERQVESLARLPLLPGSSQ